MPTDPQPPCFAAPQDLTGFAFERDIGSPGIFPFTRGIRPDMYRSRPWTMRQYAGFGDAEETNTRYRDLLAAGQTGVSVAFDLPTQLGFDPDHPRSVGEVGRVGVSIASLKDMDALFKDIPLDKVSTSMTINATAAILWAMYLVLATRRGIPWEKLSGTVQNDILKEYMARGNYAFPPEASMRLITDMFAFASQRVPKWNPISVSGYHMREAGATAVQEVAFTLADGIAYLEAAQRAGLNVDDVAPRLSFFFVAQSDLLEEVAKFRAARRMWAKIMKERFAAKNSESMRLRFHTQTAGVSLTAQQPEVNTIRTTLQALAAVLGGTQSLHTNSRDEALGLPTEQSATLALRTQQVIAYESGLTETVDPLAGSYAVESLTNQIEEQAAAYLVEIEKRGGMVKAVEAGFPQAEILRSAQAEQVAIEKGEEIRVGVNKFQVPGEQPTIPIFTVNPEVETKQKERVAKLRAERDKDKVAQALEVVRTAARGTENLMPAIIQAVEADATVGEISGALADVFGRYEPTIPRLAGATPLPPEVIGTGLRSKEGGKLRVLVAKVGMDGHDRGAKVVATTLVQAGSEVIYTRLHHTPEELVDAATQEDVQVIGISSLSGAHMTLVPRILELLKQEGVADKVVVVGGIIPPDDAAKLKAMGVAAVFASGTSLKAIIEEIQRAVDAVGKELEAPGPDAPGTSPDVRPSHLPLYLWRPFKARLIEAHNTGRLSDEVFGRVVTQGLGVARLEEDGSISIESEAVPYLTEVLNTHLARSPPLADRDVRRYLIKHEQFHQRLRGVPQQIDTLPTEQVRRGYQRAMSTARNLVCVAVLRVLQNPQLYDTHSPIASFADLKRTFVNNYGEVYANDLDFAEELIAVREIEAHLLHQPVRLVLDRAHPKDSRVDLPARIDRTIERTLRILSGSLIVTEASPEDTSPVSYDGLLEEERDALDPTTHALLESIPDRTPDKEQRVRNAMARRHRNTLAGVDFLAELSATGIPLETVRRIMLQQRETLQRHAADLQTLAEARAILIALFKESKGFLDFSAQLFDRYCSIEETPGALEAVTQALADLGRDAETPGIGIQRALNTFFERVTVRKSPDDRRFIIGPKFWGPGTPSDDQPADAPTPVTLPERFAQAVHRFPEGVIRIITGTTPTREVT